MTLTDYLKYFEKTDDSPQTNLHKFKNVTNLLILKKQNNRYEMHNIFVSNIENPFAIILFQNGKYYQMGIPRKVVITPNSDYYLIKTLKLRGVKIIYGKEVTYYQRIFSQGKFTNLIIKYLHKHHFL